MGKRNGIIRLTSSLFLPVLVLLIVCYLYYCIIVIFKEGGWQEVDSESARDKVSHFFRHIRSKAVPKRKQEKRRPPSPSHQEPGDEDHKYQRAPEGYIGRPEAAS